jgi:DNA-binding transcriptional LysR family regulator
MARLDWYIRANLKPRHMQLLVALDDFRHVGKAAAFLNITQPAVSKALAELERGLEVALFERGSRGLVPTAYGQCLIRVSRSVLRDLEAARDELRQMRSGSTGRVRIGTLPVAAPALAPRAAIRLQARRPSTTVSFQEATADRLLPLLREGLLDVVVGTLPPASMSLGLEAAELHPGDGVAVVSGMGHPLAARRRIAAADLLPYPIVMPPLRSIFRETVEGALATLGLTKASALVESGSMTATNTYLRETDAIGFYSRHLALHYSRVGMLRVLPITVPGAALPIGAVWARHTDASPAVLELIDCLREIAHEVLDAEPAPG